MVYSNTSLGVAKFSLRECTALYYSLLVASNCDDIFSHRLSSIYKLFPSKEPTTLSHPKKAFLWKEIQGLAKNTVQYGNIQKVGHRKLRQKHMEGESRL